MESERQRSSTRNRIKEKELPIDLPHLAKSYVQQNNELRKMLRRFEQEKQKQMKIIEGDIWELQKFMQELKCVTAMSAQDIMWFRERKTKECRPNTSRDKTLSVKYSQTENETSRNTQSLASTVPNVTVNDQTVGNNQTKNEEPLLDNLNQQRNTFWRMHERRRSGSVGHMNSATRERLKTISVNNRQPLLNRRESLVAGKHVQPSLPRRYSLDAGVQPFLQQRMAFTPGNKGCFHRAKSLDLAKEATKKRRAKGTIKTKLDHTQGETSV